MTDCFDEGASMDIKTHLKAGPVEPIEIDPDPNS